MKRIGNLYEQVISLENLRLADTLAQRRKQKQKGVRLHNLNREENLVNLHQTLKERRFKTPKYSYFTIFEPKERRIAVQEYFPSRIVHHAIMNVIEPILFKTFISTTYSCIKGRGIHKCLKDLKRALVNKEETKYCLKMDVKKFYLNIDKEILKEKVKRKIKDDELLNLIKEIIDSYEEGVPLGNFMSQGFANLYLNKFDHWLKEVKGIKYYFRYMDDMVILHSDKSFLHNLKKEAEEFLVEEGLTLSKHQVFPVSARGINFVGYVTFHSHTLIRKSIKQRFKRMLIKYPNKKSIASSYGWLKHGNCKNLWKKYVYD